VALGDAFEVADILLTDPEDLVQKGYGWMLKEAADSYRDEVYRYVLEHRAMMPRTALRYAIEKMPPSMRKEAMKKGVEGGLI
jgi:3-methyladenine DNA glycosylase AlkD